MTRVLVFTATAAYRHDSIPAAARAVQGLPGVEASHTEDPAALHDLGAVDVVLFLSSSGDVLDETGRSSLRRFVEGGGGFAGVHLAAGTEPSWPWFGELLGARFTAHPEGCQDAHVRVVGPAHPSTAALPDPWAFTDEWYAFGELRDDLTVLLTVDESTYAPAECTMEPVHPQAWCREVGAGRSWFTALGHSEAAWTDDTFLGHVAGGIAYAAGSPVEPQAG